MKKVLLAVSLLILGGCAGFAGRQSSIIEVGAREQVEGCQLLESFQGPSGYRMWGNPVVIGNFKNEAIQKAEKMGATHILWRTEKTDLGESTFVDAYKCPVSEGSTGNKDENGEQQP